MSKASEYMKAIPPEFIFTMTNSAIDASVRVYVSPLGSCSLQVSNAFGGGTATIPAEEAMRLAAWIMETFGD